MTIKHLKKHLPSSRTHRALLIANIIMAILYVATAYSGMVRPDTSNFIGKIAPMMNMAFPILIWMLIPVTAINLYFAREQALIPFIAVVIALGPTLRVCPLNVISPSEEQLNGPNSFKLLTYNICSYRDYTGKRSIDASNPSLAYILAEDADIVCLQEAKSDPWGRALAANVDQYDSIKVRYPYRLSVISGAATIFCKEPVEIVPTPHMPPGAGVPVPFQGFKTTIKGDSLLVVNCHLQSIGLNNTDKASFQQMTSGKINGEKINVLKNSTFNKLAAAFAVRAIQTDSLIQFINRHKNMNVIVCGDFNDTPGCWPTRALENAGLTDAYSESAFGMIHTYNKNRLYFRIDHVFYRGNFRSIDITRGNQKSSDHYPLCVTFEIENKTSSNPSE